MKIETSRFIMEELHPEDDANGFAQISKKMAWKDTIEILLNEKKLEDHIKNLAKQDMENSLAERLKKPSSSLVRGRNSGIQINIKRHQEIFSNLVQNQKYKQYLEQARNRALKYRNQLINECKRLNIDYTKDKNVYEKIANESLNPPIPISDWHYNIQFLKPDMQDYKKHVEEDLWEAPASKYIRDGIEANGAQDRSYFYFKIIDKETSQSVGIARICTQPKEFIVNYDENHKPIKQVCVGDPGLFLDPSCQGAYKGSEIYATTLNVLYTFLLSEEEKSKKTVIKCNRMNKASRRLQYSIGADITNEHSPINNRYYFTVKREKISDSGCVRKLASMGLDTYSVTIGETTYRVSLRDGILKQQRSSSSFMSNINKMMEKVKTSRPEIPVRTVTVQTPARQNVVIDVDNKRKMSYHGKCS